MSTARSVLRSIAGRAVAGLMVLGAAWPGGCSRPEPAGAALPFASDAAPQDDAALPDGSPDADAAEAGPAAEVAEAGEGGVTAKALRLVGVTSHARHTHGGDAAHVWGARYVIHNDDAVAHDLRVEAVDYLVDHGIEPCTGVARTFHRRLQARGLRLVEPAPDPDAGSARPFAAEGGAAPGPAPGSVRVPAHTRRELLVDFDQADAYYTYCDTFAFRVTLRVEPPPPGQTLVTGVAPLIVTREDPVRRRP